jgi:SAM-dependent methyltransferase
MKQFEEIKITYNRIFNGLNGYAVSLMEKQRKIGDEYIKDLLYGEISIELLYALFALEPSSSYMARGGIFYDLGSGIGNVVIGSYLIGNFKKYIGIELLDSLYNISLMAQKNLQDIYGEARGIVNFLHGNILHFDISDGDLLLFCCPNGDEKMRFRMEEKFLSLKRGAAIFSLIHVFKNTSDFTLVDLKIVKTAWGKTTLRIYERK